MSARRLGVPFDIKLARRCNTAPFTFHRLSPSADRPIVWHLRPLDATNKEYVNSSFQRAIAPDASRFDSIAESREIDIAAISSFCVDSWENVSQDGKPAECSPESALAFLRFALENGYDDEIDVLRTFMRTRDNFREAIVTGDALGKG